MTYRYRSLDTLRAIAILLVIMAHSVLAYGAPPILAPLQLGGIGVILFFVLSGWLLGGQLFKEQASFGNIDVKRFWIRRWMRTLPAYYAVLIILVIQRLITKDDVDFPLEYFFFLQNYNYPLHFFSISWSLSVEEHFYLMIAPTLAISLVFHKHILTIVLISLLIISISCRYLDIYSSSNNTHVIWDGCVLGVLLAQVQYQYHKLWHALKSKAVYLLIVSLAFFVLQFFGRYFPSLGIKDYDVFFLALMFSFWVIFASPYKNNKGTKVNHSEILYFPGAKYIATRSYAMYLLHPESYSVLKLLNINLSFILYFMFTIIFTLILSEVLYRVIELPFMELRDKLKIAQSRKL